MKIDPEIASIINMVNREGGYQKKTQGSAGQMEHVTDIVSLENAAASRSQVDTVEEARALLNDVMKDMENYSTDVHDLNQYRISRLIS